MILKAGLHYGDGRSKLAHFEEKKITPSLERFLPLCKHHLKVVLHYGDYRSKLVHLKKTMFKKALA
jgi:hypothetical protein